MSGRERTASRWLPWLLAAVGLIAVLRGIAAFEDVRAPMPRAKPVSPAMLNAQLQAPRAHTEAALSPPSLRHIPSARPVISAPAPEAAPLEAPTPTLPSAAPESPARVDPPAVNAEPTPPVPAAAPASKPHRVPFAVLAAWSKPGLCSSSAEAAAVREKMTAGFRAISPDDGGSLYLDPRLPEGAEQPVIQALRRAEAEVGKRLALRPARPLVFVYADQSLMKAAACINENVVAFYDGALHIVANRNDVQQSLLHEYTHHALFSSGFITPAWAQEGMAMNVAQERWWRDARYLQALVATPFSPEQMDSNIPYKLPSEQAIAFYVQSAALVECLLHERKWALPDLLAALRAGASSDSLSYNLPELDQSNFLRSCLQGG